MASNIKRSSCCATCRIPPDKRRFYAVKYLLFYESRRDLVLGIRALRMTFCEGLPLHFKRGVDWRLRWLHLPTAFESKPRTLKVLLQFNACLIESFTV